MRLGDLDALTEKLKNGLENAKNAGKENYAKIFEVFIDWVSREPTIDAMPVVRCRECENYDENGDCISLDLRIGIHSDTINYDFCPDPDFYCAYGRRKIETALPKSDAKDEGLEETHANTRKNAR